MSTVKDFITHIIYHSKLGFSDEQKAESIIEFVERACLIKFLEDSREAVKDMDADKVANGETLNNGFYA